MKKCESKYINLRQNRAVDLAWTYLTEQ